MSLVGIPGFQRAAAGYQAVIAHPVYTGLFTVAATAAAVWASNLGSYFSSATNHVGFTPETVLPSDFKQVAKSHQQTLERLKKAQQARVDEERLLGERLCKDFGICT